MFSLLFASVIIAYSLLPSHVTVKNIINGDSRGTKLPWLLWPISSVSTWQSASVLIKWTGANVQGYTRKATSEISSFESSEIKMYPIRTLKYNCLIFQLKYIMSLLLGLHLANPLIKVMKRRVCWDILNIMLTLS